jgi:hypothetical protein
LSKRTFEYGGYNFFPVRKLESSESGFFAISKRISIDTELGLCEEGYAYPSKFPYSYEDFYKAADGHEYDLFRCLDNGKIYIPCHHDLQLYREEKNKTFEVTITETLTKAVTVEAADAIEAQQIVTDGYYRGHHILLADDFRGVDFEAKEAAKNRDDKER